MKRAIYLLLATVLPTGVRASEKRKRKRHRDSLRLCTDKRLLNRKGPLLVIKLTG